MRKALCRVSFWVAALLATQAVAFDQAYTGYANLLQRYVHWTDAGHASAVDYAGLSREHARLRHELDGFSAVGKDEFDHWDRTQQMAFLINAYNAWTLELILGEYPDLESIRDLGGLFSSPWKKTFVRLFGAERSLDWIEHEQLRPRYADPRVHFALNCASVGCPALRPEPYVAASLETQLEDQQRRFLEDRSRNRFDAASGTLQVSSIFKWYGEDFSVQGKGLDAWLATRAPLLADDLRDRDVIAAGRFEVQFLPYNWSLNDAKPR
ncbi:MAG: DUF547 domain-containing protein [Panacagrimonas sp.]